MISEPRVTRQQLRASMKPKHGWTNEARDQELQRIRANRRAVEAQPKQPDLRPNPIGQTVTWTSSNLEKTGEIVAVVPAGERPSTDLTPKVKDPGVPRDHESYVVKANGKHYWPRVSLLSIA